MERKTVAIGIGVGMLGAAGVGLGAMIRARRERRSRRPEPGEPGSLVDFGDGTVTVRDAVPTGSAGAAAQPPLGHRGAKLTPPDPRPPRTATRMAPGIPVGSGRGIDSALGQPDTDIGGGVAGDTTVTGAANEKGRDERTVRNDDHDRTTL